MVWKLKRTTTAQQRLNANGRMVARRKIVHLMKILLAGTIYFQKCPPALSLNRYVQIYFSMQKFDGEHITNEILTNN